MSDLTLNQRLAAFFNTAMECWADGQDFDGQNIQEEGVRLGLLVETRFNSDVHTNETGVDVSDGDQWFVIAPDALKAIREASPIELSGNPGELPPSQATTELSKNPGQLPDPTSLQKMQTSPDELAMAVERVTAAALGSSHVFDVELLATVRPADLRLILSRLASPAGGGCQTVPLDPTEAMIEAGRKVGGWGFTTFLDREAAAATYRAMLAAAPDPRAGG